MCATDKPLFFKNCEQMSFHLDRAPKTEPEKWLNSRQVERSKFSKVAYNVTWDSRSDAPEKVLSYSLGELIPTISLQLNWRDRRIFQSLWLLLLVLS